MSQTYNNYAKKNKSITHSHIMLMTIFIVFLLSLFLYFASPKLIQYPLYFPSATTLSSKKFEDTLKIELRMIPKNNFVSRFMGGYDEITRVKDFIYELFLGPQSIYLKAVVPQEFTIERVMKGSIGKKEVLFLLLKTDNTRLITKNLIHTIRQWLYYNLKTIEYKQEILLIINGELF